MTQDLDPLAQAEVESHGLHLSRQLTEVTNEVASAVTAAAEANSDFELAKARALLDQIGKGGTVPEKQARALLACEETFVRAEATKAVVKGLMEAGRNIREQLEWLRSLNANVRDRVIHPTGRGG